MASSPPALSNMASCIVLASLSGSIWATIYRDQVIHRKRMALLKEDLAKREKEREVARMEREVARMERKVARKKRSKDM